MKTKRHSSIAPAVQALSGMFDQSEMIGFADRIAKKATDLLRNDDPGVDAIDVSEVREFLIGLGSNSARTERNEKGHKSTETDLLEDEWSVLTTPMRDIDTKSPIIVRKVEFPDSELFGDLSKLIETVHTVDRLREVRAFKGFRRVSDKAELIHPNLGSNLHRGYPLSRCTEKDCSCVSTTIR